MEIDHKNSQQSTQDYPHSDILKQMRQKQEINELENRFENMNFKIGRLSTIEEEAENYNESQQSFNPKEVKPNLSQNLHSSLPKRIKESSFIDSAPNNSSEGKFNKINNQG